MHTSNFVLRGGDAAFANRQKLLFDQLSIAENECIKHDRSETDNTKMEVDVCDKSSTLRANRKRKRETNKFRGKESIFKRPEGPAPRTTFRNIPDYHRNPHKWVKYSLDDVSSEDMTDRSNTQAAMSFLRELKARRKKEVDQCEEKMDVEPCKSNLQDSVEIQFKSKKRTLKSQIMFKKPQDKEAESSETVIESDDMPVFRSSKIILPEYVVGQKPKKINRKNQPVVKVDRSKELKLDHLQEPDEDEDN